MAAIVNKVYLSGIVVFFAKLSAENNKKVELWFGGRVYNPELPDLATQLELAYLLPVGIHNLFCLTLPPLNRTLELQIIYGCIGLPSHLSQPTPANYKPESHKPLRT